MNILWIPNFTPFPPDNGGKLLTYNRMKQVAKQHSIYMIVESEEYESKQISMANEVCKEYVVVQPIQRNLIQKIISVAIKCRNVEKYRNPKVTEKICEFIDKYNIDLINFDLPMPAVNILPIKDKLRHIPVVINQQNVEFNNCKSKIYTKGVSLPMKIYSILESKKLYAWERNLYRNNCIKAISHVSEEDKRMIEKSFSILPKFSEVMPIGTTMPASTEKIVTNDEKKHIVFPASFDYAPNAHGAVWFVEEVWPLIKKEYENVDLYLVGRDPKPEVKKYNGNDIIVTGTVDKITPYFAMADMFVVPIFFGGGVKTKLIEMGCWKRPVVSTIFGAKGTVYNDEDIILCDEPSRFAENCIEILAHPEKFVKLCESMYQKTTDNYLWNAIGRQYIDFLNKVVGAKSI